MIISIIGSGNTATVLGRILKENHHTINEIIGRNKNRSKKSCRKFGCKCPH